MRDDEYDITIGTGGWVLVVLSGVVTLGFLWGLLHYHFFPSLLFALAIALIVVLVLYRLAAAVNRYDDAEEARRVRKIVPGSGDAVARVSGVEGASAVAAKAVPVHPSTPVPQRPSSVVTPLANVEPAPVIAPPPVPEPKPEPKPADPAATAATALVAAAKKPKAEKAAAKAKAAKPAAKSTAAEKPAAKLAAKPAAKAEKPAPKPKAAKAAKPVGLVRLTAPRGGVADDLKEIEGIGPALEKMVNGMGFYHFDQLAAWTDADVALVDAEMKTFKGRITRDKWVAQAKIIVTEGLEAFRERAKTNNY